MKQTFLKTILFLFAAFSLSNCSKEENDVIEHTNVQNLQSNFSLENFDDHFVKNNLVVAWDDYSINDENDKSTYEFNTSFKVASSLTNGKIELATKYKLLAFKDDSGIWDYELIKFLSINDKWADGLSYFNPVFSGTLYNYNLTGETTAIKAYKNGVLLSEFAGKQENILSRLDPVDGSGSYQRICTTSYTDWYSVYDSTAHYSHSVKTGESCDWVYMDEGDGGNGGTIFHNHYDGNHGTNGSNNNGNHDNEFFTDDVVVIAGPAIPITDMADYLKCFDVSQKADITLYVNEPYDGTSNLIGPDRVGHTFVSIKQGNNIATFGFYPVSSLSSFFLNGVDSSMGNNSNTDYDVSLTMKDVSASNLQQIITLAKSYSLSDYSLNQRNCTDMGIELGNLAGLAIPECDANPIFFLGSTPGKLGEYMRNLDLPIGSIRNLNGGNSPSNNCN